MPTIEEAAEKLEQRRQEKRDISGDFEEVDSLKKDSVVKESFLKKKVQKKPAGSVAGVDGGLLKKRYSSADVVVTRAVAAVFKFKDQKSVQADYIPSKNPGPDFFIFDQEDDRSLERNAESERLRRETEVAERALSQADTVLLDGSVVPSYLEDEEVRERYAELYAESGSGKLVGVVEDSHGLELAEILEEKTGIELGKIRDTVLMDAILDNGERSFVRSYSGYSRENSFFEELDEAEKLNTFYVKLSEKDLPLRIDFYGSEEEADLIAGKLIALKSSDSYTVPSPVLEADKRAKIPEKYLKRLEKRFSPDMRRRDRRSF